MTARRRRAGVVYLLHFAEPYKHARHYVGFTEDLTQRIEDHRAGRGAKLTGAAAAAGIPFVVARTWEKVTRTFERRVHRTKNSPKVCPICSGCRARPCKPRHTANGGG